MKSTIENTLINLCQHISLCVYKESTLTFQNMNVFNCKVPMTTMMIMIMMVLVVMIMRMITDADNEGADHPALSCQFQQDACLQYGFHVFARWHHFCGSRGREFERIGSV